MKKLVKPIFITCGIILILIFLLYGGFLGAGSYGYAQEYKFNVDEYYLFKRVQKFKLENPEYIIPISLKGISDSFEINKYSSIYLFYQNENEIVHIVIFSPNNTHNQSILALDAIKEDLFPGNWKLINKDFDRDENLAIKKQFSERFLERLDLKYKDNGNNMFIFWK